MRKATVLAAVVLGTLTATTAAPAWATVEQTVGLSLAASGWSWNPPGGAPIPASAVGTPGDLVVGYAGDSAGAPSAKAYLALDLSALPAKSTVTSLPVVLTLDSAAHNVEPSDNALLACLTAGAWKTGEGTAASEQPKDDCTTSALGRYDATAGTYTFDVGAFVDAWQANSDLGLVIRPSQGYVAPNGAPFQLSFVATKTLASAQAQLASPVPPQPSHPPQPVPVPQTDQGGTGFTSGPGLSSGSTGGGAPVTSGPAPVAAPPAVAPVIQAPTYSIASPSDIQRSLAGNDVPPTGFWLSGALGLLVLGLISWAVGDTRSQRQQVRAAAARRDAAHSVLVARRLAGPVAIRPRRVIPAGTTGRTADLG